MGLVLWMAVIVAIATGLAFSPLTAPTKWKLVGIRDSDQGRVEQILNKYKETPWARLPIGRIQDEVNQRNAINSVTVSANIFGRATCRVIYRNRILKVGSSESHLYLDDQGTLFRDEDKVDEEPTMVKLPDKFLSHQGSIAGNWSSGDVIRVDKILKSSVPSLSYTLAVDDQTVISLWVQDGPKVVLGSGSKLQEKIAVLARVVNEQPETFRRSKVINLMSPDNPTVSP